MATIGCCRFENTFPDLMDCYDHINDDLTDWNRTWIAGKQPRGNA